MNTNYMNKQSFLYVFGALFMCQLTLAQITVDEKDNLLNKQNPISQIDSVKTNKIDRVKVDGVAGVVGDYLVLESDIQKLFQDAKSQGYESEVSYCDLAESLLENKLLAHHAVQDSLPYNQARVDAYTDQQIAALVERVGSMDKLVEFYKYDSESELKEELKRINKEKLLSEEMQGEIVDAVEITPEETRQYFEAIPVDERPVLGDEVEIAQIVIYPESGAEEQQAVIDRLNEFRTDVLENGASFATKAILYSEDLGSRRKGGKITLKRDDPYVKEFKEAAFSLREGEVSRPFKTEFGYHILTVEKIRGQQVDVRHILLYPEVTKEAVSEAKEKIKDVREKIISGDVSFANAAREASDEKETRESGGQLINGATGDTRFELSKIDPSIYDQVVNLKEGEVSKILTDSKPRTNEVFFKIITVNNRIDEHVADFTEDYTKIRELALKKKQAEAISKWVDEKLQSTYVKINGEYRDCEFAQKWIKK
ncbi:MAG: peptidylprolyl isomerase [Psychroflexus halocasei]